MRQKTVYRCSECGADAPKWMGWCPACEASGTLGEEMVLATAPGRTGAALVPPSVPIPIAEAVGDATEPVATGDPAGALSELQRASGALPRDYRRQVLSDTSAVLWALITHKPDLAGWQPVHEWVSGELERLA